MEENTKQTVPDLEFAEEKLSADSNKTITHKENLDTLDKIFEFKYEDSPRATKSMHAVCDDLNLEKLWVIHPGDKRYPLTETFEVVPLCEFRF